MPRLLGRSWIDAFLEYTDNTEAPREYLLWSGLSVLSSTLKNNVYIEYYGEKFPANQYIILVGPPGIGKGVSIGKAYKLAKKAKSVNFIKNWHTPQEVIELIGNGFMTIALKPGQVLQPNTPMDHTACIIAPELAVFLQSYDNLHSILCDMWDQKEFEYGTRNKGKFNIEDMSVSMLGGCVPDYIRSLGKDRMAPITGGFTARTVFVYATEKYQLLPLNFGALSKAATKLEDDLINDLVHIGTLKGELTLDKEAEKLWIKTYSEHNKRGIIDSDASTNFKSRISTHVLKTAIAISLSESDSFIITRSHLARAIKYIEHVRDQVDVVFRSVGESTLAVVMDKVLNFVDQSGQVSYKTLLKRFYRDATDEQLNYILRILIQTNSIVEGIDSSGKPAYEALTFNQGLKAVAQMIQKGKP